MRQQGRGKEASKRKGFCGLDQIAELRFSRVEGKATTQGRVQIGELAPLVPRVSALCQASNWRRATAARLRHGSQLGSYSLDCLDAQAAILICTGTCPV